MEWTVISLGLSYLGVSIAFMGLMWRMFKNQFDGIYRRFETIDQRFEAIDHRSTLREHRQSIRQG